MLELNLIKLVLRTQILGRVKNGNVFKILEYKSI